MSLSGETKAAVKARRRERGGTYRAALKFVMAEREAAKWNERWPVGTPCILERYRGATKVNTATRSAAWPQASGHATVMIEGYSGGYGLDFLTPGKQLPEVTP